MSDYVRISLTDNKTGAFAYPETSIEQVKIGNNTLEDITNVVNLTALKKQHYANLMTAIAAFNSDLKIVSLKKFGLIITFATNSNYNLWESWKFIDNNLSNFNNINKWQQDGLSQNSGSSNTILIKSLLGNINLTCNFSCYGKINHPYRPKDLPEEINENCFGYNTISVDGTIYQYIIGYTSGIKFERSNVNGVWGDWIKPFGLSRNLQNGGYNINVGNYYINVPTQYDFNIIYNTVIGEEKQITFVVTNGRYINNLGLVISDENYSISSEIELKSGWLLTMKALGNQDITSMISLVNDNDTYTPLVIANRSVTHNYTYYCENDCTIILSFYSIYGCYATHKNNVLYQRISTLEGYFTDGAANSAIKLDTSVYLWGNEFNGTQSLDGHIESIGDIHTTKRIYGEGGVSAGGIGDLYESGGAGFTGVVEEKTGNSNVVTGGHKNDGNIVFEMALEVYSKEDTNDLLDAKVDKVAGYGLSQNNLTDELIQSINNVITDVYTKTYIDNNFVPYEGASKDVNLGDYSLSLFNLNAINNIHADGGVSAGGIGDLSETTSIIDLYRSWDDLYPTNKALEATLGVELYNSLTDLSSSTHTHSNKVIIDGITSVNLDHWNDSYTHSQITNGTNPHATTFANIANKPTTISGYGITDAASKTYIDNNFVPYEGASKDVNLGDYSLSLFNLNASNNIHADGGVSAGGIGDLSETTSIIDLYRSWDDLYPTNKALEATLGVELHNSLIGLSSAAHTHSNKDVLDSTTAAFLHEEKIKLAGIEANANKYVLPYATSAVLGGVTVGSNIDINDGVISVKDASTLNKGVVQLSDSIGSSSSLIAATSKAVKAAWDLADSKWLWNENTIKGVVVNRSLTADKLTAQISLWGQLFDGSSDINGDLHSTGNISADGGVSAGGIGDLSEAITSGYNDILPHPDNTGNAVTSITSNGGSTLYYRMEKSFSEAGHNHNTVYQPLDSDLTAIAGLTGTSGFLKKTAANTWSLDTNVYLTGITKAQVEDVLTGAITSHTHNYQAPLTGTGFVKSAAGVISYDNNTYLTTHQTIYGLTIQKNGTTVATFVPNSADKTINISDVASADTLDSHISNISNPHAVTKAQVGLGNVEDTKLSTWAGTDSITTLGTISSGTWNATKIGVSKGGTGKTSIAIDRMLYASSANTYEEVITTSFGRGILSAISETEVAGLRAATATKLASSVYLWGNEFNGTQSLDGHIESIGDIHTTQRIYGDTGVYAGGIGDLAESNSGGYNNVEYDDAQGVIVDYVSNVVSNTSSLKVYRNKLKTNLSQYIDDLGVNPIHSHSQYMLASLKGTANGLAELDSNGLVPASQLPSYVDDVLTYTSLSVFPATGIDGKIYIASDTNLTYRWSGTAYVEISKSLALGETGSTAYRGDRGKAAYDHSQASHTFSIAGQSINALDGSISKAPLLSALNVADGAQVNVLEGIKLNGTALTPDSKIVNVNACTSITVPTGLSVAALSASGLIAISLTNGYAIPTSANIAQIATNTTNIANEVDDRIDAISQEVTDRNTAISSAINALDVASVGGGTYYISAISETNGKISATAKLTNTLFTGLANDAEQLSVTIGDKNLKLTVDYATKAYQLKNTKTIWGRDFNGTQSVSGNMTGVGSIESTGNIHTTQRVYGDSGVFSGGIGDLSEVGGSGYNDILPYPNESGNAVTYLEDNGSTLYYHLGNFSLSTHNHNSVYSVLGHTHDDRYYTETEIRSILGGSTSITGYTKSNWDTAYGWGNHASAGYASQSALTDHANLTTTAHGLGASAFHPDNYFAAASHTHTKSQITDFPTTWAWASLTGTPSTFAPSAHTLDSHSNVTITSNSTGEILKWNGSAWINNTLAEAGIAAASHTHTKSQITDFTHTHLWADLTDKPTTFTPSSHTHGNITNGGYIGSTANLPIITGTGGILQVGSFGTTANTFCQGNDSRLSNARIASDVYAWAKAATKPAYTTTEVSEGTNLYFTDARAGASITKARVEEVLTGAITSHTHDGRYYTESEIGNILSGTTAVSGYNKSNWDTAYTHSQSTSNPHGVTKAQVGLGNVLNVASYSKTESDTNLTSAISAVEIGGRNLWLDSSIDRSYVYWNIGDGVKSIDTDFLWNGRPTLKFVKGSVSSGGLSNAHVRLGLPANTEFVYSFMAHSTIEISINSSSLGHMQVEGTGSTSIHRETSMRFYPSILPANTWTKVSIIFKTPSEAVEGETFTFRSYLWYLANGGTYHFVDFQLEKGNKATDWTPAPEDVQVEIDLKAPLANPIFTGSVTAPTFIGALSGNASTATKLYTGRTLKVNLASTSASTSFNGTANITDIGVSGILPTSNGGTGNNTFVSNKLIYAESATKLSSMYSIVGSTSVPIYLNAGAITACTPSELFSFLSWNNGTTSGPTLNITVTGQNRTSVIPSASASYSGVVTTGTQTFAGSKTFNSTVSILDALSVANSINAGGIIQGVGGVFAGGIADLGGNEYAIPAASASSIGGIKIGYTNNAKNYKVALDVSGNAFVNVPWVNTVYSGSDWINISGTTINNLGTWYLGESSQNGYVRFYGGVNPSGYDIPIHGLGSAAYTNSSAYASSSHNHSGVYEPVISTKNTAFNVNFGTAAGTACVGNDSRLSNSRPASDVSAWAKASTKPSYTYSEVGAAASAHTHAYASTVKLGTVAYAASSNIISLPAYPTTLPASDVSAWAKASSKPSYAWNEITSKPLLFASVQFTDTPHQFTSYQYVSGTELTLPVYGQTSSNPLSDSNPLVLKSGLPTSLPASDVSAWAKAATKPSYTYSEVGAAAASHTHAYASTVKLGTVAYAASSNIISLPAYPTTLPASDVSAWAKAATKPSYTYSEVGAASSSHNHSGVYEPVISTKKAAFNVNFGDVSGTACQGNDSRLNNARAPLPHTLDSHSNVTITSNSSGEILKWNGSAWINNTLAEAGIASSSHNHSGVYEPVISTKNTAFNVNFGTVAGTACQGNDSRLSNSRPASDVSAWAKAATKPSYAWNEITSKPLLFASVQFTDTPHQFTSYQYVSGTELTLPVYGQTSSNPLSDSNPLVLKSGLPTSLPASDVSAWAKATTKPSYTYSEVGAAAASHTHSQYLTGIPFANDSTLGGIQLGVGFYQYQGLTSVYYGSSSGTACQGNDSRLSNSRPASDVSAWAKASSKPSYTYSEVGAAAASHGTHLSGTSSFTSHANTGVDANIVTSNIVGYYTSNGPSTIIGASTADGALYSQAYSSSWVGQIAQDYRNGNLFVRGKNNGTWQSWKKVAYSGESQPASDVSAWAKAATKPSYTYSEVGAAAASHTHAYASTVKLGTVAYAASSNIISLPAYPTTLPASDVSAWAKAATKPSYTYSEVGAASSSHNHSGVYEPVISTKKAAFNVNFGDVSGTACQGNDSRLNNARAPLPHTLDSHSNVTITSNSSGEILKWNGSAWINNTLAEAGIASSSHTHSQYLTGIPFADAFTIGGIQLGAGFYQYQGVTSVYYGDVSGTACQGNDSRLSNSRPASDVSAWAKASTKPSYTYSEVGAASSSHNHSGVYEPVISTKNTAFNVNFGTTSGTACKGNDLRLYNARTPSAHTHSEYLSEGSWTTPTLTNATQGTTYGAVRYRKIGTNVQIDGSFTVTISNTNGLRIFQLNPGYEPVHNMSMLLYNNSAGIWRCVIGTDGKVSVSYIYKISDGSLITTATMCMFDKCIFPIN